MWFLILFLLFTRPVLAQDATASTSPSITTPTTVPTIVPPTPTPYLFNQYNQDYLYQYGLYQQAYLDYVNKKQVYTKYGTITTRKDKFTATINALSARNLALRSYLIALRTLLNDYQITNPTATQKVQIDLSKWESWTNEQTTVIPALNNDSDVTRWATDFKNQYPLIQKSIYTALVQHEANLRQTTLNQIQSIADSIKSNSKIQPESQQWISTLAVKSDLVNTSINNSINFTQRSQNQGRFSNFYPDSRLELSKANNYLIEIIGDLKLIVTKFYHP